GAELVVVAPAAPVVQLLEVPFDAVAARQRGIGHRSVPFSRSYGVHSKIPNVSTSRARGHVTKASPMGERPATWGRYAARMRSSPYSRILVLLDGTERAERVLAWVRHLALGGSEQIHLLMVEPAARAVAVAGHAVAFVDQLEESARAAAQASLEPLAIRLRED